MVRGHQPGTGIFVLHVGNNAAPQICREIILRQTSYSALIIFSVVLCMLATIQFVKQSLQMYRVTKQWQLNQYINLLVKHGIVYFFAFLLTNLTGLLYNWGVPSNNGRYFLLTFVEYVPVFTLTPRLVISIWELHEHDVEGRRGSRTDSGFGLSTLSDGYSGTARSRIVFASRAEGEAEDNVVGVAERDEMTESIWMVSMDPESA